MMLINDCQMKTVWEEGTKSTISSSVLPASLILPIEIAKEYLKKI